MRRSRHWRRFTAVLVAGVASATLLSSCSRTERTPAPDVVPAEPQLFANGPGVAVAGGSSPDQTAGGPLWWFTAPEGAISVYNGSDEAAVLRVRGNMVVPCGTPARMELTLPDGRRRMARVAPQEQAPVVFAVEVPARDQVEVAVAIDATACQPKGDARTLYAGLLSLRAKAAGTGADSSTAPTG